MFSILETISPLISFLRWCLSNCLLISTVMTSIVMSNINTIITSNPISCRAININVTKLSNQNTLDNGIENIRIEKDLSGNYSLIWSSHFPSSISFSISLGVFPSILTPELTQEATTCFTAFLKT